MTEIIRVLELYSGIGGMHCALQGSVSLNVSLKVIMYRFMTTIFGHKFTLPTLVTKLCLVET